MKYKYSVGWIVLHTSLIVTILLSLLTGLRIATLNHSEMMLFSFLLPQGEVIEMHIYAAYSLLGIITGYIVYLFNSTKCTVEKKSKHFLSYATFLAYLFMSISVISGLMLYTDSFLPQYTLDIHYYTALAILVYILFHAGGYFIYRGIGVFKQIFTPIYPLNIKRDGVIFFVIIIVFVISYTSFTKKIHKTLTIQTMPDTTVMHVDGDATESVWKNAPIVEVKTYGGANFINGETTVQMQAVKNSKSIFFHFTWRDETKSLKHLPLQKTKYGWKVLETDFYNYDEQVYYEDKFAVMLSNSCEERASSTVHLGSKPLSDKPANWHHKGYHYIKKGMIRDLWHWKAVRSDIMHQMDDNFIGKPDVIRTGERRYVGGILSDAKESGAYTMNWQWYSPFVVVPKKIPKEKKEYKLNTRSVAWYDYDFYDIKKDNYSIGTLLPSVLHFSNQFEGDRADVTAKAQWHNGMWSLEAVRHIDTGSKHDVSIINGTCLWVAAFDHSQIAHTRHSIPIKVKYEVSEK